MRALFFLLGLRLAKVVVDGVHGNSCIYDGVVYVYPRFRPRLIGAVEV